MKICAAITFLALSTVNAVAGNILSIGVGSSPNDNTGDPLRTAMQKTMTAVNGLASCFNGTSAPSSSMTYQCWFDTSTSPATLRYYDGAVWVAAATLNASTHVFASNAASASTLTGATLNATVLNSSLTSVGTLTALTVAAVPVLPSQTANMFFAAPDGSSGVPTFRAFVLGDLPALSLTDYYLTLQSLSPVPGKGFTLTPGAPLSFMVTITTAAQEAQGGIFSVTKKSNETSGGASTTGPTSAIYGEVDIANGGLFWNQSGVTGIAVNSNTTGSQPIGSSSAIGVFGSGICHVANCVATWGGNLTAVDDTATANPINLLIGLEVDVTANGGDSHSSRIGLLVSGTKYAGIGLVPFVSNLVSLGGLNTSATYGNVINILPGTTALNGIDLTQLIPSSADIRMIAGHNNLLFTNASNVFTSGTAGSIYFKAGSGGSVNQMFFDNYDNGIFVFRGPSFAAVATIGATPGASTKTICSDAAGIWFAKTGTC